MKKNISIISIALLLLILAVFLISQQSNSTLKNKEKNFAIDDTATITKIYMADKRDNQILLNKTPGGAWMVNDSLRALPEKVETLLRTLNSITVQRPVSDAAHNNVISRLAARSVKTENYQEAYRINLFDRIKLFPYEKKTRTYFVGGETQDKLGTFMLMEDSERPYVVGIPGFRGFVSTRYTARLADWRHHQIFDSRINEIKSLSIKYSHDPEDSFRIESIDNRSFKLFHPEKEAYISRFDTVKVIEYLTAYRNIRFENLLNNNLPESRVDSIKAQEPVHTITLKTYDNEEQVVETHYMPAYGKTDLDGNPLDYNPEKMYAFINDGQDFVTVQFFVFDKLLKPVGYFTGNYEQEKGHRFKGIL
jgi:hypothetical protein